MYNWRATSFIYIPQHHSYSTSTWTAIDVCDGEHSVWCGFIIALWCVFMLGLLLLMWIGIYLLIKELKDC